MKNKIKTNVPKTVLLNRSALLSVFILPCFAILAVFSCSPHCFAEEAAWVNGGPKYLYSKGKKKPPMHPVYDESMKCVECHEYDGVDAYTSATMSLKKSTTGTLPRAEMEKRVAEILKGHGDYRELYVLSTSFENRPLGTAIEFVLDTETFTFYAFSERQGEELFRIASNSHASLTYVKQLEHGNYFKEPLGVQVEGTAKLLLGTDSEFEEAIKVYIPTLERMTKRKMTPERIENIKKSLVAIKITAEQIVMRDHTMRGTDYRKIQIWQRNDKQ